MVSTEKRGEGLKDILIVVGLALLVFAGAALDSRGLAGWIAAAGVLAGFGLIGFGMKAEEGVNFGKPVCKVREKA